MKKRYFIIFLALPFLVLSCVQENLQTESTGTTISITVTLTAEADTPNTKVSLEEDGLGIILDWEEGDKIDLCLTYKDAGGVDQVSYFPAVSVKIDPSNSKKATFPLTIPGEVHDKFNLYGLYGGGGLSSSDPTKALLPDTEDLFANDLQTLYKKKVLMLQFEAVDISKEIPSFGVQFQHLGSFFKVLVKNTGSATIENVTEAVLKPEDETDRIPAYFQSKEYDMVNKHFITQNDEVNKEATHISLPANVSFIVEEGIQAFWAWLPVAKGEGLGADWPGLQLVLKSETTTIASTTYKPGRKATSGKVYHFFATCSGNTLAFVGQNDFTVPDGTATVPLPLDENGICTGVLADTRDGNLYATVKIGDQTWLAENLKYLPDVFKRTPVSDTEQHYHIYGYGDSGVNLVAAKQEVNYTKYGVLYNWQAAMDGSSTSNDVPSGVQGPCPPGWHLPSCSEWSVMEQWLTDKRYAYNQSAQGTRANIAKALSTKAVNWETSGTTGAPGNIGLEENMNLSGFSVLPAGSMGGGGSFTNITKEAMFWTSKESTRRKIDYDKVGVDLATNASSKAAFSIRCVKNY